MKPFKPFILVLALAAAAIGMASAGLATRDTPTRPEPAARAGEDGCPPGTFDIYFPAHQSEVSPQAKALMMGLALAYRRCPVERIEIASLAVDSASPDSTPEIAAERGRNLAGLVRLIFLGRTDVVVRVEQAEDGFGPEARRAQVRLVT